MTNSFKTWLIIILSVIVLTGIWFWGYFTYKSGHPCLVSYDTTYVTDTVTHTIQVKVPYYVQKLVYIKYQDQAWIDSVMKANQLDSAGINFYATYQYERTFEDTLLKAVLEDRITQNKPAVISFDYTIKRPQTVIQNIDKSVNYNKYLYIGGSIPLYDAKMSNLGLFVAFPRGLYGIGYSPYKNGVTITAGFKIIQLR